MWTVDRDFWIAENCSLRKFSTSNSTKFNCNAAVENMPQVKLETISCYIPEEYSTYTGSSQMAENSRQVTRSPLAFIALTLTLFFYHRKSNTDKHVRGERHFCLQRFWYLLMLETQTHRTSTTAKGMQIRNVH